MPDPQPPRAQIARYDGPRTVDELARYSQLLTTAERGQTNTVLPSQYRGNPAALAFAVEYAKALDVSPVTAITGIHVIDGKPSASAGLISALVRRAGHRLRVWATGTVEEGTLTGHATILRVDDPEHEYRAEFTLRDAARAELLELRQDGDRYDIRSRTERGRRTQWEKYPRAMVKARALTEVAREAAEDAVLGVHYTPEELGAIVDEAGEPVYTVTQVAPRPQDAPGASQQAASGPPPARPATSPPPPQQDPTPAPSVGEVAGAVMLAGDVDTLRQLWRRAHHYDLLAADVTDYLEVADIDQLTGGDGLPSEPVLGWLIQACGRYLDHQGKPLHARASDEDHGVDEAEQPASNQRATAEQPPADPDPVDELAARLAGLDSPESHAFVLAEADAAVVIGVVERYPELRADIIAAEESGQARTDILNLATATQEGK